MDEAKPAHQEGPPQLSDDEWIVDVVAGERERRDRDHHPPVEQPERVLPDIEGGGGPNRDLRMAAVSIQCWMHGMLLSSPAAANMRGPAHRGRERRTQGTDRRSEWCAGSRA